MVSGRRGASPGELAPILPRGSCPRNADARLVPVVRDRRQIRRRAGVDDALQIGHAGRRVSVEGLHQHAGADADVGPPPCRSIASSTAVIAAVPVMDTVTATDTTRGAAARTSRPPSPASAISACTSASSSSVGSRPRISTRDVGGCRSRVAHGRPLRMRRRRPRGQPVDTGRRLPHRLSPVVAGQHARAQDLVIGVLRRSRGP